MDISIHYTPFKCDELKEGKADLWVRLRFKMFEELTDEFRAVKSQFPPEKYYLIMQIEQELPVQQSQKHAKKSFEYKK